MVSQRFRPLGRVIPGRADGANPESMPARRADMHRAGVMDSGFVASRRHGMTPQMHSKPPPASAPLEELHLALVLLGRRARLEGAEIAPPAGLRIGLAGIEAIDTGAELADHRALAKR